MQGLSIRLFKGAWESALMTFLFWCLIYMSKLPLYLAHGAGAGHQSSDFLRAFADTLTQQHARPVVPVTFDYMKEQERTGKRRPPSKFVSLVPEFAAQIGTEKALIVAGKSMGGRVATQLSEQENVKAIVCLGFPFHPPGKPEKHRLAFLDAVSVPCLIIQGTRDPFGKPEWVNEQTLNEKVEVQWFEGADHDFKTLKKQKLSTDEVINNISVSIEAWLARHGLDY
jgi:predicted alpha/beta-hydrolase family hydrolase